MTISEFARISGTSRKTLIYYDEMGLFSPAVVGTNGYRYYTMQQFFTLDTINILKMVDMPLKEIKDYLQNRTPDRAIELFAEQEQKLLAEIERLTYSRRALLNQIWRIKETSALRLNELVVEECPMEFYYVSQLVKDASDPVMMKDYFDFLANLSKQRLHNGYPLGGTIYSTDGFLDPTAPHEYQLAQKITGEEARRYQPEELLIKPAGRYLTQYLSMKEERKEVLTDKMKAYIEENHMQATGPLWEFWWRDDTVTSRVEEQIYQFSIQVEPKSSRVK